MNDIFRRILVIYSFTEDVPSLIFLYFGLAVLYSRV